MKPLFSILSLKPPKPVRASASTFVLERDLNGRFEARGAFRSITGLRRAFTAYLDGRWDGQSLTLVEDFVYDDGEVDTKTWRLRRLSDSRYIAAREGVIGEADGYQDGSVFRLEYDLSLKIARTHRTLRFRDVMAKTASGEIINNATVAWFGIKVASVSILIRPAEASDENSGAAAHEPVAASTF